VKARLICYSVRRLNPFQGTLQVAELGEARALSLDGVRWEIQIRCAQPEHTWRSANQGEAVMRYLRFGAWSKETGVRRVPLSPILDLDLMLEASAAVTGQLAQGLDPLPFASADLHELWLLDGDGLPFALLVSSVQAPSPSRAWREPWSAGARSDHSFQSRRLLARGLPARLGDDPRHHASLLERLVRDAAGRPARLAWFRRDRDGGGDEVAEPTGKTEAGLRRLGADHFPHLLFREDWPDSAESDLVGDYLYWCSPYLLKLPGLDDARRDRLEHAAKAHALKVESLHRLYPKILNPGLLKLIRVEARMRLSGMTASSGAMGSAASSPA